MGIVQEAVSYTHLDVYKRQVQQRLIQWGYMTGSADGVYGAQTQAAVKQFQRKYGLTADGRVGPATAAKMGITLTSSGSGASSSATTASIVSSDHRLLSKLVYAEARGCLLYTSRCV